MWWIEFAKGFLPSFVFLVFWYICKLFYKHKKRKAERKKNANAERMRRNKQEQKEKEKEAKKMAKFYCDACGKITDVKNSRDYNGFDLCPSCYQKAVALEKEITETTATINAATAKLSAKREELKAFFVGKEEKSEEIKNEKPTEADVLKKLGL